MTTTAVKERPILFSGPMVRAILAGQKTQTRRSIKPQPTKPLEAHVLFSTEAKNTGSWKFATDEYDPRPEHIHCPYGHPGDRLWVRETLEAVVDTKFDESETMPIARYAADCSHIWTPGPRREPWIWKNRALPSIHMPRRLCRIILEITGVRAERLKSMPYDDAAKEGFADSEVLTSCATSEFNTAHRNFALLWDKLNGPGAYDLNPWVWVVSFKRIAL